jgi:hypothetical protein
VAAIIFIYVGDIELYLDSSGVGFDVIIRVAFINRDKYLGNTGGWCDVSCVFML